MIEPDLVIKAINPHDAFVNGIQAIIDINQSTLPFPVACKVITVNDNTVDLQPLLNANGTALSLPLIKNTPYASLDWFNMPIDVGVIGIFMPVNFDTFAYTTLGTIPDTDIKTGGLYGGFFVPLRKSNPLAGDGVSIKRDEVTITGVSKLTLTSKEMTLEGTSKLTLKSSKGSITLDKLIQWLMDFQTAYNNAMTAIAGNNANIVTAFSSLNGQGGASGAPIVVTPPTLQAPAQFTESLL